VQTKPNKSVFLTIARRPASKILLVAIGFSHRRTSLTPPPMPRTLLTWCEWAARPCVVAATAVAVANHTFLA